MTQIGNLFGNVSLRTAQLDKDVKNVSKKLGGLGKDMTKLGKSLSLKVTAPIAAFGALSVKAFAEQEKSEASLRAALEASGQEVERNMVHLRQMASEIQKVTVVGDEMSLALMQQGISMGLQADKMDEATRGAIGLSKAFNLDLKMAMRASTAALQGQTEMLTRYIPELKNIEDPAERVALVQQKMAEGFQIAEAEAQTTTGKMQQLKNAFGDLQETIGEILAEYLTPVVEWLGKMIERIQTLDPAIIRWGITIAGLAATLGPLLIALGAMASGLSKIIALFGVLSGSVAATIGFVAALGVGLGLLLDHFGFLEEAGYALGDMIYFVMEGQWGDAIGAALRFVWELVDAFTPLPEMVEWLGQVSMRVFDWFGQKIEYVIMKLKELWDWWLKIYESLPTTKLGNFLGDQVSDMMRAKGGPVDANSPYIVGEEGPELFVPRYSGSIVPNDRLQQASSGQTFNMNFAPGTGMDIIAAIKNNRNLLAEIAVAAVRENQLRTI